MANTKKDKSLTLDEIRVGFSKLDFWGKVDLFEEFSKNLEDDRKAFEEEQEALKEKLSKLNKLNGNGKS